VPLIYIVSTLKEKSIKSAILQAINGKKYLTVDAVKRGLTESGTSYNPTTVNQYLFNLKIEGKLLDAGRGWYTTIKTPLSLNTKPIKDLALAIKRKFPLLEFTVWSTEQLQPFAHHMMTQFTNFVYTDVDTMATVAGHLKDTGYNSYLNPQQSEVDKYFEPSSSTVVVRQSVTEEPVKEHYATIEKILVDLFLEKDRLHLMDGAEYERIFRDLILSHRINMPRLLRYAGRRKVKDALVANILIAEKDVISI
jgi:hypothetical protein